MRREGETDREVDANRQVIGNNKFSIEQPDVLNRQNSAFLRVKREWREKSEKRVAGVD